MNKTNEKDWRYKYFVTYDAQDNGDLHFNPEAEISQEVPKFGWDDAKLADYVFISEEMRKMLGRVLTVIDAAIVDNRQNKAVKDTIRGHFTDEYAQLTDMLMGSHWLAAAIENAPEKVASTATLEEAAGA